MTCTLVCVVHPEVTLCGWLDVKIKALTTEFLKGDSCWIVCAVCCHNYSSDVYLSLWIYTLSLVDVVSVQYFALI